MRFATADDETAPAPFLTGQLTSCPRAAHEKAIAALSFVAGSPHDGTFVPEQACQ